MKNKTPLVSVICSCYNHSKYVTETLDSVIKQSYKNIQLIIIDDFSTDNSVEIIKQWVLKNNQGTLIINEKNLGITKSFNKAFSSVKGDYFIDLAADDLLLENCIELQVDKLNNFTNNDIGIVYGNASVFFENKTHTYNYFDKWPLKKKTPTPNNGYIYTEILNHTNTICSVSALIKTDIYKELGGYDSYLSYEDYDFWLRVSRKYIIIYIDNILAKKRELTSSLSASSSKKLNRKSFSFNKSTYVILKKIYKMNRSKTEDLASIKKINIEIEKNLRILNLILCLKYCILLLKFKYRKTFI